jgi:hypothetical protein
MIMNKINKIITGAGFLLCGVFACTDDTFDRHYHADPNIVAENNLWESLTSIPELSRFTEWLKIYGYDESLSQTQAYTVFAPNNEALALLDTSGMDVVAELIENHIARFMLPLPGNAATMVATLNRKRINFENLAGNYYFGSAAFTNPVKSLVASNGIIHVLNSYESFFPNTWEYLSKGTGLDSIKNYLYAHDEMEFIPELSVPGDIVDGQQTYLDSFFFNNNTVLSRIGYINQEDSSYVMIVPDNTAWIEAYNRIKDDFVYYNKSAAIADSMQRTSASFALVQDLVFNNRTQISPQDSLVSTTKHAFFNPQSLFEGANPPVTTSNGTVYVTSQLKFNAWESWHEQILVEAERTFGRENTLSTPLVLRTTDGTAAISDLRYLQLEPTTSTGNPTVTFEVPNTLSSYYNIYCVFVSGKVRNPNAEGLKPCKVYFNLSYLDHSGNFAIDRFPESGTIETDPNIIDTVLVASNFKFPTANFDEKKASGENDVKVTLKVVSNVGRSETTNFSRELLLDCIYFEPKKQ